MMIIEQIIADFICQKLEEIDIDIDNRKYEKLNQNETTELSAIELEHYKVGQWNIT